MKISASDMKKPVHEYTWSHQALDRIIADTFCRFHNDQYTKFQPCNTNGYRLKGEITGNFILHSKILTCNIFSGWWAATIYCDAA